MLRYKSMSRNPNNNIKLGDYLVTCDRSGFKAFRSDCVRQWDGLIILRKYAEERHPLDLQRPPRPERAPEDVRTPNEVFLNPGDVTADDL